MKRYEVLAKDRAKKPLISIDYISLNSRQRPMLCIYHRKVLENARENSKNGKNKREIKERQLNNNTPCICAGDMKLLAARKRSTGLQSASIDAFEVQSGEHPIHLVDFAAQVLDIHGKAAYLVELASSIGISDHFGDEEFLLFQYD
jgi:hypothetical protein